MISAAITPGTQPHAVSNKVMRMEPQPLSITARGGNKIDNNTLQNDMAFYILMLFDIYCNYHM